MEASTPDHAVTAHEHGAITRPAGPPRIIKVRLRPLKYVDPYEPVPTTDILFNDKREVFHRTTHNGIQPHRQAHEIDPHTVVVLRMIDGDEVLWKADAPFKIVAIEPRNPFDWDGVEKSCGGSTEIRSGVPIHEGRYKMTFEVEGIGRIDPDLEVVR